MIGKKKIITITKVVIIFDLLLIGVVVSSSRRSGYVPDWSFKVADFIQILVVEAALLGPYLFEYWKVKQNKGTIKFLRVFHEGTYNVVGGKVFGIELINNSQPIIDTCKVYLRSYSCIKNKEPIKHEINKYLGWLSLDGYSISLNPFEPTIFILGSLPRLIWMNGLPPKPESVYFNINCIDEGFNKGQNIRIRTDAEFEIYFYSDNADIYSLTLKLLWPKEYDSAEDLFQKIHLELFSVSCLT